jgi:hypothetical protein
VKNKNMGKYIRNGKKTIRTHHKRKNNKKTIRADEAKGPLWFNFELR